MVDFEQVILIMFSKSSQFHRIVIFTYFKITKVFRQTGKVKSANEKATAGKRVIKNENNVKTEIDYKTNE